MWIGDRRKELGNSTLARERIVCSTLQDKFIENERHLGRHRLYYGTSQTCGYGREEFGYPTLTRERIVCSTL
ncbi:hypothetical protein CEXT_599411 [Caerostris extrusa]|uniref:Uncharacterized protein n=1 Tax=Caerostris extrusa TaxID=172846 RepID=A0AAV4P8H4_CAEEX|nr:hypothetical protein CEXT_599411 [Caerostris extrusa]